MNHGEREDKGNLTPVPSRPFRGGLSMEHGSDLQEMGNQVILGDPSPSCGWGTKRRTRPS